MEKKTDPACIFSFNITQRSLIARVGLQTHQSMVTDYWTVGSTSQSTVEQVKSSITFHLKHKKICSMLFFFCYFFHLCFKKQGDSMVRDIKSTDLWWRKPIVQITTQLWNLLSKPDWSACWSTYSNIVHLDRHPFLGVRQRSFTISTLFLNGDWSWETFCRQSRCSTSKQSAFPQAPSHGLTSLTF